MPTHDKVLWVVNYDRLEHFVEKSLDIGVSGVAIRTDNNVVRAIPAFHDHGIKVFEWRWPSAKRDPAMREADKVTDLLSRGLDGYIVDPEGARGKPYDWDLDGLDQLADDFCRTITAASAGKPFGTTSHYRGKKVYPRLPWPIFFEHSTILLPQAYWRSDQGTIGSGIPENNYRLALDLWTQTGGDRTKIVPMAGELGQVTSEEIDAYASEAAVRAIRTLHFYAFDDEVDDSVWDAIQRA
jgi:hypothetical protein